MHISVVFHFFVPRLNCLECAIILKFAYKLIDYFVAEARGAAVDCHCYFLLDALCCACSVCGMWILTWPFKYTMNHATVAV